MTLSVFMGDAPLTAQIFDTCIILFTRCIIYDNSSLSPRSILLNKGEWHGYHERHQKHKIHHSCDYVTPLSHTTRLQHLLDVALTSRLFRKIPLLNFRSSLLTELSDFPCCILIFSFVMVCKDCEHNVLYYSVLLCCVQVRKSQEEQLVLTLGNLEPETQLVSRNRGWFIKPLSTTRTGMHSALLLPL